MKSALKARWPGHLCSSRQGAFLALAISVLLAIPGGTAGADEHLPGGDATVALPDDPATAFSQPSPNLDREALLDFRIGNAMFRKVWLPAPSPNKSSDGLGPLFNAQSCDGCHTNDGRGNTENLVLKLSVPSPTGNEGAPRPEPAYGWQLQDKAIPGHSPEGRIHLRFEDVPVSLADGTQVVLRKPFYRITDPAYGPLHRQVMISPRIAPQLIGLGLLEAIAETVIVAQADPEDRDRNGVSGRANRDSTGALGRFGWKAGKPTILKQVAAAFSIDMGISSSLAPSISGDCTTGQTDCRNAPDGTSGLDAEISDTLLQFVARYSRNLAVPERRQSEDPDVRAGRSIFNGIGCAACHRPSFQTGKHPEEPHLSDQLIWPYTDLLLHDMGEGLADERPEDGATGREWRTPPLWGIGLTKLVNGNAFFLHDGRARSITEAILWHDGEAKKSRDLFANLPKTKRKALLAFVNSL